MTREETHVHHQALKPLANQCLKPGCALAGDLAWALHLSRGHPKKHLWWNKRLLPLSTRNAEVLKKRFLVPLDIPS